MNNPFFPFSAGRAAFVFVFLFSLSAGGSAFSQKAPIDTAVLNRGWPSAGLLSLSGDGRYAAFELEDIPAGSNTLVIRSTDGGWQQQVPGARGPVFLDDDRHVLIPMGDSLCLLGLGTGGRTVIPDVRRYTLVQRKGGLWLLCLTGVPGHQHLLWEQPGTDSREGYSGVQQYWLSSDSSTLVWTALDIRGTDTACTLQTEQLASGQVRELCRSHGTQPESVCLNSSGGVILYSLRQGPQLSLHWYEPATAQEHSIWSGTSAQGYAFDPGGGQLVFMTPGGIMYYKRGAPQAVLKVSGSTPGIDSGLRLGPDEPVGFTTDGRRIFFALIPAAGQDSGCVPASGQGVQVDVWHYRDPQLQSVQLAHPRPMAVKSYLAVMAVGQDRVVRVEAEGESGQARGIEGARDYVLLVRNKGEEWWWQPQQRVAVAVVSLAGGARRLQRTIPYSPSSFLYELSPDGRYLLYYDPFTRSYVSDELSCGQQRVLTTGLAVSWEEEDLCSQRWPDPVFGRVRYPAGLCGWVDSGRRVLVYSSRDIWCLDPSGRTRPRNLTAAAAAGQPVRFRLVARAGGVTQVAGYCPDLSGEEQVLVEGLNEATREAGIYRLALGRPAPPQPLLKGPYAWAPSVLTVIKAARAQRWAVLRSSEHLAPNWAVTGDFSTFRPLTDLAPEKTVRWYTTELVIWTLPGGASCQGVLCKPEDFDSTRRYPLLFNYYETSSGGLHSYIRPQWLRDCNVNVPYFVSRGYLVFMPDIHIRLGHPGLSALQAVESAARWLMKRPYVDGRHMAVLGHSYGGFETNYIVTHSSLFAAAAEGAGMTDAFSDYGTVMQAGGYSRQFNYEISQSRIGATPWQRPDLYRENSPVLAADQVTTPLLILHNRLDNAVPWAQGVELFTALRRLGKPAWLLQYDGEKHGLVKAANQHDYTLRLTQFLDHYLKGAPAPIWMMDGIPAACKGSRNGYETSGSSH